jgi:hypothetical protein
LLLTNNRDFNPAATLLLLILMSDFPLKLVMLADGKAKTWHRRLNWLTLSPYKLDLFHRIPGLIELLLDLTMSAGVLNIVAFTFCPPVNYHKRTAVQTVIMYGEQMEGTQDFTVKQRKKLKTPNPSKFKIVV